MITELKNLVFNNEEEFISILEESGFNNERFHGFILTEEKRFGGEGQGDNYWIVFSAEKDGIKKFFKLDGWYSSYEGSCIDSYSTFYEVEEVEKVVKVWENV